MADTAKERATDATLFAAVPAVLVWSWPHEAGALVMRVAGAVA